jgi:hypothetical protein
LVFRICYSVFGLAFTVGSFGIVIGNGISDIKIKNTFNLVPSDELGYENTCSWLRTTTFC